MKEQLGWDWDTLVLMVWLLVFPLKVEAAHEASSTQEAGVGLVGLA